MKRYSLLLIAIAAVMVLASAATARLTFDCNGCPLFGPGCFPQTPDGYLSFKMQQGFYDNQLVWFISTDTNQINFATANRLTLAPKLSSGLGTDAVDELFIVTNPACTQGPIFESAPPDLDYTPIWHVNYITWINPAFARPITNADPASDENPNGIPGPDLVTITSTDIVFDCPIVAVGPLGGPWFPATGNNYRIPQGVVRSNYIRTKKIYLPFFLADCQNELTKQVSRVAVIFPDAAKEDVAAILGANFAPALGTFPIDDTQRFWFFVNPVISCQLPVEEWCPTKNSVQNTQFNYSPIEQIIALDRSLVPPCSNITSRTQILALLSRYLLTPIDCGIVNSPIRLLKCHKRIPVWTDTLIDQEDFCVD